MFIAAISFTNANPSDVQFIMCPYHAWRSSHRAHHQATKSLERDQNFVPRTRTQLGLPAQHVARLADYHEIFEDAPLYTLIRILVMQLFGWHSYIFFNVKGNPRYPSGTNVRLWHIILHSSRG